MIKFCYYNLILNFNRWSCGIDSLSLEDPQLINGHIKQIHNSLSTLLLPRFRGHLRTIPLRLDHDLTRETTEIPSPIVTQK